MLQGAIQRFLLANPMTRSIQTSSQRLGLEEFFDDPKNFAKDKILHGREWRTDELRIKSNSDLHKLWFVLYKERNMLYTMKEASKEANEVFPSPERIDKVETSMANLENVVRERNKAYWQLEVSPTATGERPYTYRRDILGRHGYKQCSQHLAPYHKNWWARQTNGPYSDGNDSYFQRYREMRRQIFNAQRSRTARHIRNIFRRFPNADADYLAELHPEFPTGYVQHLKKNLHLYDDPQPRLTRMYIWKDRRPDQDINVDSAQTRP